MGYLWIEDVGLSCDISPLGIGVCTLPLGTSRCLTHHYDKMWFSRTIVHGPTIKWLLGFDGKCLHWRATLVWKCVHVRENNVIVNKIILYLIINIVGNTMIICVLLCYVLKWQCINASYSFMHYVIMHHVMSST
jgi:hypothetical protein